MEDIGVGCTAVEVNCSTRCDTARASLREAQAILAELVGSHPSDVEEVGEPSNKVDKLELWLDNLVSESHYIVEQLHRLTERIG